MSRDQEHETRETMLNELVRGRISRRQFMQRMLATGLGLSGVNAVLAACAPPAGQPAAPAATQPAATQAPVEGVSPAAAGRPLTPTYYQWIINLHPSVEAVNKDYQQQADLNFQIAPVEGFGIDRFVAEARDKESTWDVYVGMTPFVEMASLIEADVIEPWDNYIPQKVIDDLIPSIREECTFDGKLYSWPFLLDIIVQAWHSGITDKAGLPEDSIPQTWDEYLANSQQILDSEAALYGCTFDAHGWRSLAPIAHSLSTDVYTEEGLFDFTNDAVVEALKVMKDMFDLSHPNVLLPGTADGGVNNTPDEDTFASEQVGYYVKYQNAPLRFANTWPDPTKLRMAGLPKFPGGEGATVFWTTGACLFKWGENKEKAAEYMQSLTYDQRIWRDSIGGSEAGQPGQLPPYQSIYAQWEENKPDWMEDWVPLVRSQLEVAAAIQPHKFGVTQFFIGQPLWEKYIKGELDDPKAALQEAKDAVLAEIEKVG